jgi:hypothetical protein
VAASARVQFGRILTEVVSRSGLNAPPTRSQVDLVHVRLKDLFLRVGSLQLQCDLEFLELALHPLLETDRLEHVAGELLCDGAPAPAAEGARGHDPDGRPQHTSNVHAPVLIEASVFDGHERLGNVVGKGMNGDRGAALDPKFSDELTIMGVDFGGLLGFPRMDLRDGWAIHTQVLPGSGREAGSGREQEEEGRPDPGPTKSPSGCLRRSSWNGQSRPSPPGLLADSHLRGYTRCGAPGPLPDPIAKWRWCKS